MDSSCRGRTQPHLSQSIPKARFVNTGFAAPGYWNVTSWKPSTGGLTCGVPKDGKEEVSHGIALFADDQHNMYGVVLAWGGSGNLKQ